MQLLLATLYLCHSLLAFFDSHISCPLPPKPGFGVWVWEGLSGGSRAGLTLERCSQLAAFAIRPVGWDAAAVWLAEGGVFRCAPLSGSNLVAFGRVAARERQGALSRRAWWFSIRWVRTRFGEGGGQLDRWRARGGLNPCARESKARTGRFLREKLISDHGHFSSYEGHMERRTGKIREAFSRMHRALWRLDAGSRAGFNSSRPPPPWTSVFQFSLFLYDV